MNNDDWDSVSNDTPPDSAANAWDAVSAPQPSRKRRIIPDNIVLDDSIAPEEDLQEEAQPDVVPSSAPRQENFNTPSTRQEFISASFLKKAAIVGGVVLLLLVSSFGAFQGMSIHNANVNATVTAQQAATALTTHTNATTTPQVVATAATEQQIYNQAMSGSPVINDPLSANSTDHFWAELTPSFGTCTFIGGAYDFTAKAGFWIACTGRGMVYTNFALQVQMSIAQGGDGSIVFGDNTNGFYRVDISSMGTYTVLQYTKNDNQVRNLRGGSSSAFKTGLNQANVITVIVNNGNFYLFANNQFITNTNLGAYNQGGADLATVGFSGQASEVAFSNLKVWSVP